ncbi:Uncharacterized protein APZ42_012070 [Daphnia magna]|uniref:Uncharacterized protein n=1 Tax=Daphnia magna TaxID=35525 RepID=A0A162S1J8_9CRUS|nr:Uncharacterized protein APZ42_012070 [Daphnia magna]
MTNEWRLLGDTRDTKYRVPGCALPSTARPRICRAIIFASVKRPCPEALYYESSYQGQQISSTRRLVHRGFFEVCLVCHILP